MQITLNWYTIIIYIKDLNICEIIHTYIILDLNLYLFISYYIYLYFII
nr:MAG TPA: hypothetical protein [Caudoviricetes sp.]